MIEHSDIRHVDALSYLKRGRGGSLPCIQDSVSVIEIEVRVPVQHIGGYGSSVYTPQRSLPGDVAIKQPVRFIALVFKCLLANPHQAPIRVFYIRLADVGYIPARGDVFIIAAEFEDIAYPQY